MLLDDLMRPRTRQRPAAAPVPYGIPARTPGSAAPVSPQGRHTAPAPVPNGGVRTPSFEPAPYRNARQVRRDLMNAQANLGLAAYPQLLGQLGVLGQQAQESRMSPELRAAYLAPRLENLDDQYRVAQSELTRTLLDRGLDVSSGAVQEYSSLAGDAAQARSGLMAQLYQTEDERQRDAQQRYQQLLAVLLGAGQNGANIAGQLRQERLAGQQQGGTGQGLLSGLFGLGGAYLGGRR